MEVLTPAASASDAAATAVLALLSLPVSDFDTLSFLAVEFERLAAAASRVVTEARAVTASRGLCSTSRGAGDDSALASILS